MVARRTGRSETRNACEAEGVLHAACDGLNAMWCCTHSKVASVAKTENEGFHPSSCLLSGCLISHRAQGVVLKWGIGDPAHKAYINGFPLGFAFKLNKTHPTKSLSFFSSVVFSPPARLHRLPLASNTKDIPPDSEGPGLALGNMAWFPVALGLFPPSAN